MASGGNRKLVAYFEVRHADQNEFQEDIIEVFGNQLFYLGRNPDLCERSWGDATISGLHLRIHCILYESDPIAGVPPFVYATDLSTNGTDLKHSRQACPDSDSDHWERMKKNTARLLADGDELRIIKSLTLIYREMEHAENFKLTFTQERERPVFASRYLITGRLLGAGGYGKVYVAYHQKTQDQLACKVINLKSLYNGKEPHNLRDPLTDLSEQSNGRLPTQIARCFREFQVLEDLAHPNIISIEKVFLSSSTIYIFEELVPGGDLFSFIEYKGGYILNYEAAVIVRQILKGIEYLHGCGIVHRDLKPDNILMTSLEENARVVITDFGNARYLPESQGPANRQLLSRSRMFSQVGTLGYAAPEIYRANQMVPRNQGYSKAVDMWSIGAVAAAMLSGEAMFTIRAINQTFDPDVTSQEISIALTSRCDLSIIDDENHPTWSKVSSLPKDFVKSLLILSEVDRMTVDEALEHVWFTQSEAPCDGLCDKSISESFGILYQQSIKDWEQPSMDRQLVEVIPPFPHKESHHFPSNPSETLQSQSCTVLENEEAQFEGPDRYEEDNGFIRQNPEQPSPPCQPTDAMDYSMEQLSTSDEPTASGMYSASGKSQQKDQQDAYMVEIMSDVDYGQDESIIFPPGYSRLRASQAKEQSPTMHDSVRFPPGYTRRGQARATPQSSVVYETPLDEITGRYVDQSHHPRLAGLVYEQLGFL